MQQHDERRIDSEDGKSYTREEFVAQYGHTAQWDAAVGARMQQQHHSVPPWQQPQTNRQHQQQANGTVQVAMPVQERRTDPDDGELYTRGGFIEQYGGTAEWDAANCWDSTAPSAGNLPLTYGTSH
jgi:hypothetical protein